MMGRGGQISGDTSNPHGHFRTVYACGHLKAQCRCIGPKRETILREEMCPNCTASKWTPDRNVPCDAALGGGSAVAPGCPHRALKFIVGMRSLGSGAIKLETLRGVECGMCGVGFPSIQSFSIVYEETGSGARRTDLNYTFSRDESRGEEVEISDAVCAHEELQCSECEQVVYQRARGDKSDGARYSDNPKGRNGAPSDCRKR